MLRATIFALIALSLTALTVRGDWPDASLLNRVPPSANALLAVDVSAAYDSPLAKKEGWAKRYAESQVATLSTLPPFVKSVLVASEMDFARLSPRWQIGFAESMLMLDMGRFAQREGTTLSRVADRPAVASPRGAYFTNISGKTLAAFAPADRQAFARWLRGETQQGNPSAYLREAAATSGGAQALIAVDLTDVVDPALARIYFAHLPTVVREKLNANLIASLFTGVRGFTLRLTVTDTVTGKMQIDFAGDVSEHARHLPAIIEDVLVDAGAVIDDVRGWQPSFGPKKFALDGPVSSESLRRLIGMFEIANVGGGHDVGPSPEGERPTTVSGAQTARYFRSLETLLGELRRVRARLDEDKGYERYALWFENTAKKIEQLNTVGVDSELVHFGLQTAGGLHAIAGSLRGVPIRTNELASSSYYVFSTWGASTGFRQGVGGVNIDSTNIPQVRQKIAATVAGDKQARNELWTHIDTGLGLLRAKLSERYKLVF